MKVAFQAAYAYRELAGESLPLKIIVWFQAFKEVYGYLPPYLIPPGGLNIIHSLDDKLRQWGFKAVDRAFRVNPVILKVIGKITNRQGLQSDGLVQIVEMWYLSQADNLEYLIG